MAGSEELRRLATLDIVKARDVFLELPPPEESRLTDANSKSLIQTANNFYQSWRYLASAKDLFLGKGATVLNTGETLSGVDLWCRLFFTVGAYYDFSLRLLLRRNVVQKSGVHPLPGVGVSRAEEWTNELDTKNHRALFQELASITEGGLPLEEEERLKAKLLTTFEVATIEAAREALVWESYQRTAGLIATSYTMAMFATIFGELLRTSNVPQELTEAMDGIAHRTAARVFKGSQSTQSDLAALSNRLLASIFEQWGRIYDRTELGWSQSHNLGPFSSIRLPELASLAKRDARMAKKYGDKQIAKIFEHCSDSTIIRILRHIYKKR
jgi:hypothetical protein